MTLPRSFCRIKIDEATLDKAAHAAADATDALLRIKSRSSTQWASLSSRYDRLEDRVVNEVTEAILDMGA